MNQASLSDPRKPLALFALAGLLLSLLALGAMLGSGLGAKLGWWHFSAGLRVADWAAYGAAAAATLAVIGLVRARPRSPRTGFVAALLGLLVALPMVIMAAHWEYAARAYPAINDISTDTSDAPVFWDMPNPSDYPGAKTAALQRQAYPDLAPMMLAIPPAQAFAAALAVVKDKGWTVVASVPNEGRIEATARSRLYGFTDEVAVRVRAADGGSMVDLRSRSRVGRIDRGVNANRIRSFADDLRQHSGEVRP